MIHHIISQIKLSANTAIENEVELLVAANTIENLLNQIDFTSEIVPIDDFDRLKKLLTSLKEEELNTKEIELITIINKTSKN